MPDATPPVSGIVGVDPAVTTSCGFGHRLDTFDTSAVVPLRSSSCLSPDPVNPSLFLPRSRPWLLAKAAEGGLESAPASRLRGAFPHQSNSCAPPQPFGCVCARGTQKSVSRTSETLALRRSSHYGFALH